MKKILSLSASLLFALCAYAQCGDRYYNEIFSDIDSTLNVEYGRNINYVGDSTILTLAIYQPAGDLVTSRPLIIFAHGGFFIAGDNTEYDIVDMCHYYTKMGYVCASINYRQGVAFSEIDSIGFGKAIIRAVQDARAAIRFFKEDAQATAYGIDTGQIFLGGTSAGGVLAVHAGFMTAGSTLLPWVQELVDTLGGLEGNSGHPGLSSAFKGVISFAGAIVDTAWIVNTHTAICSTHSKDDPVVPYGAGIVTYLGIPIARVMGSSLVHEKADMLGIPNAFLSFDTSGHVPHLNGPVEFWETETFVRDFLYSQLDCFDGNYPAGISEPVENPIQIYPNPARDHFTVEGSSFAQTPDRLVLYNLLGVAVLTEKLYPVTVQNISIDLPAGIYLIKLFSGDKQLTVPSHEIVVQ